MAINQYTEVTLTTQPPSTNAQKNTVTLELCTLHNCSTLTHDELRALHHAINSQYALFLDGLSSIKQVIPSPEKLAALTVATFLETHCTQTTHDHNLHININSNIPIGCGLGSSAALIVGLLKALDSYAQTRLTATQLIQLARHIEDRQHGHSSGLDVHVCYHGGGHLWQKGTSQPCSPSTLPFQYVHTGQPASNSGEAVSTARKRYRADKHNSSVTVFTRARRAS